MPQKQQDARLTTATHSPTHPLTLARRRGGMLAWLVALFVARWLIPTEGAAEGLTLWLVQLVLFTAVARAAWAWRFDERPFRWDAMDGAIALLIVAQVVSALAVVVGVGNARAAINVAWEWIGSGVWIWMLRRELTLTRAAQQLCWGLSLTAGVLAGYGLWQYYVGYDEMTREYDRLTTEHDRLAASGTDERRLQSLRAEMVRQEIPIEPTARFSLEQRLKRSREPLGLFALTNTFAGLLVVMLLISLGLLGTSSFSSRAAAIVLALAIAFCLVLTKSRTAWVGLSAGLAWGSLRIIVARWRRGTEPANERRRPLGVWIAAGTILVGIVVAAAAVSGGLDKAVLSEAPKSLRYRLEWWQGTWETIREHIFFGTGPGNFRDYYLAHKLPESSEEIADPHNLVFDVWANAGTLGLIGLLACLGLMVRSWLRPTAEPDADGSRVVADQKSADGLNVAWTSPGTWGDGLAFPLSAVGMELLGYGMDERLWWLGGIWWGLWLVVWIWSRRRNVSSSTASPRICSWFPISLEAANVALLVHLLGAGGIAMPAITQLLWLVWAMRVGLSASAVATRDEKSPSESARTGVVVGRVPAGVCALAAGGLCVVCLWTATLPELLCRTSLQMGDWEWQRRQAEAAQARYLDAAAADRWSIEPFERLAEVAFQRWQQSKRDTDFDEAAHRLQSVTDRLPFASRPYRRLGQAWLARFEHSREPTHALTAAKMLTAAVVRYPHHAELLAELATACQGAGLSAEAKDAARRAVQQDDINRQAGHTDKFLRSDMRQRMGQLAAE